MAGVVDIRIASDAARLAQMGAEIFCRMAKASVQQRGRFVVALSGGSTPRAMFRRLAQDPYRTDIPWQDTHLFWVDERMVAYDDDHSNYGAAERDLLDNVPLPENQIHPMPYDLAPQAAADRYQEELTRFFDPSGHLAPVFDLIFLGIGADGHTASLFPGKPYPESAAVWVVAVQGGEPDLPRLSLTYSVLNRARKIVFLVSGSGKAGVLKTILENPGADLPARKIAPSHGKLIWLLDGRAASLLAEELTVGKSIRAK